MSDDEIRQRVLALGKNIGPVNGTNRGLYIKMLSGNQSGKKSPRTKTPTRAPSPKKSPASSPRPSVTPRSVSPRRGSSRKGFDSSNSSNLFDDDSFSSSAKYSPSRSRPFESSVSSSTSRRSKVSTTPERTRTHASDSFTKRTPDRVYAEEIIKKYTPDIKNYFDEEDDGKYSSRRSGASKSYNQGPSSRYSAADSHFTTPEKLRELKSRKPVKPPQSVNIVAVGFLIVMAAIIFYYAYYHRIKEGVNDLNSFFATVASLCYKYAIIPVVFVLTSKFSY